jgi:hypothetical protein
VRILAIRKKSITSNNKIISLLDVYRLKYRLNDIMNDIMLQRVQEQLLTTSDPGWRLCAVILSTLRRVMYLLQVKKTLVLPSPVAE